MSKPVIVSGGFGFIGANLIAALNAKGIRPKVLIRSLGENWHNVAGLSFDLMESISYIPYDSVVIHLGANVNTRESMNRALWDNNVDHTIAIQKMVADRNSRLIYASSASVYGAEENDCTERIAGLKPLNAYAMTKWAIDNHFFAAGRATANTYGLRFFNVYGPREGQKGGMASVIHKGLNKLAPLYTPAIHSHDEMGVHTGTDPAYWTLFKSEKPISRDFIYVGDVAKVISHFIDHGCEPGVYNVGSGRTTSFEDVMKAIEPLDIKYVSLPLDMKPGYQHHSKADLTKLRAAGFKDEFLTVEQGIDAMRAVL